LHPIDFTAIRMLLLFCGLLEVITKRLTHDGRATTAFDANVGVSMGVRIVWIDPFGLVCDNMLWNRPRARQLEQMTNVISFSAVNVGMSLIVNMAAVSGNESIYSRTWIASSTRPSRKLCHSESSFGKETGLSNFGVLKLMAEL